MSRVLNCSLTIALAAFCAGDCAAKKTPKAAPDPKFTAIRTLAVLPIVDARAGDKAGVNLPGLQHSAVNILKSKHYAAAAVEATGASGEIAVEDLDSAAPAYIKKLGPPESRWVLVVCLQDIASKITFGSTGNAEVSGYLFDKETGEVIWKGKGAGQAGQGGLMGMAMKGMMKGEALGAAISDLFASMPNLPKPGK